MYIKIPMPLSDELFIKEFGMDAFWFYKDRISQRMDCGKIYLNPLKTMYIWAKSDKATHQGYYSDLFIRNRNSRRCKNHGRS